MTFSLLPPVRLQRSSSNGAIPAVWQSRFCGIAGLERAGFMRRGSLGSALEN